MPKYVIMFKSAPRPHICMMHHTTWINILRNNDSGGKQGVYSQIRRVGMIVHHYLYLEEFQSAGI